MVKSDTPSFNPTSVYISDTPWFMLGNSGACATNLTVTTTLNRGVMAMCRQSVTTARYVTVAKMISVNAKYFGYAEITPFRQGELAPCLKLWQPVIDE